MHESFPCHSHRHPVFSLPLVRRCSLSRTWFNNHESLYTYFLGDFILSSGFKYYLYTDDFQIYILTQTPSINPDSYIQLSTWQLLCFLIAILTLAYLTTEFWFFWQKWRSQQSSSSQLMTSSFQYQNKIFWCHLQLFCNHLTHIQSVSKS